MKMPITWYQARDYAIRKGFDQDAEDFAQIAYLKIKRGRQTTIGNLFTDYLRERYGRTKNVQRPYKSVELLKYVGLDQIPEGATVEKLEKQDLICLADYLEGEQRVVFVLKYLWGMTGREIGYCFGISEAAISLRLNKIEQFLIKKVRQTNGQK